MTPVPAGWMTRVTALLGGCRRCTRTSKIAALCAWVGAFAALLLLRSTAVALAAALLATALTGLWIAHLLAHASRGTLASMLRQFGAEPQEARSIIEALRLPDERGASRGTRLQEGEALSVQRGERPDRPGFRLTRIVVANDQGVIAAVGLTAGGAYTALDPASIEAEAASSS